MGLMTVGIGEENTGCDPGGTRKLYFSLAELLSPWTTPETFLCLVQQLGAAPSRWQRLYALATVHWCVPLLYETLHRHGCLAYVEPLTRAHMRADCLHNRLRNQLLRQELIDLHGACAASGIPVLLLKGAATFADDLYGSFGARSMIDLDLLLPEECLVPACALLAARGYVEVADEGKQLTGLPIDQRHAHINLRQRPGSPARVELHYRIAYAQGGRVLTAATGWHRSVTTSINGTPALMLQPTWRLLHNTVHGLLPCRDFIRGEIRFWHILEFAWLAKRYWQQIDWRVWVEAAHGEHQTTAFLAWLWLAHRLFALPIPREIEIGWWPRWQGRRLANATVLQSRRQNMMAGERLSWWEWLLFGLHRLHYWLHLPGWVWRNVCYAEGGRNVVVRVRCFVGKVMSRRSWGKV